MNNFLNKIISTLRRNSLLLNIEHVKIHFVCNLCDARDAFDLTGLSVCRNHIPILSSLITEFVARITRRMSHAKQEFTLLEHMRSPPVYRGVHVARSLVLYNAL